MRKISEPKVIRQRETFEDGTVVSTEITVASQFDLLPAWAQWSFLTFLFLVFAGILSIAIIR